MDVHDLPIEIQEVILEQLDGKSLLNTRSVCQLWRQLSDRRLEILCLTKIPEDILTEIISESSENCSWGKVWGKWQRGEIGTNVKPLGVTSMAFDDPINSMAVLGSYLVLGTGNGQVLLLSEVARKNFNFIRKIEVEEGAIYQIVVMEPLNLVFAIGESSFHPIQISDGGNMTKLDCDTLPLMCRKFSVYHDQIVVNTRKDTLGLYYLCDLSPTRVSFELQTTITCPQWVYEWKLWDDKVTCLLNTGEVCVYDLNKETWIYLSSPYSEIQYQNPCFMFRDSIFCSSLTSRSLLAYWHMDRGVFYWMLSWSGPRLSRVYLGEEQGEEVTCLSLRRQLFVCGTQSGKVLVFLSKRKERQKSHSRYDTSDPVLNLKVSEKCIKSISIGFCNEKVFIVARTNRSLAEVLELTNLCNKTK